MRSASGFKATFLMPAAAVDKRPGAVRPWNFHPGILRHMPRGENSRTLHQCQHVSHAGRVCVSWWQQSGLLRREFISAVLSMLPLEVPRPPLAPRGSREQSGLRMAKGALAVQHLSGCGRCRCSSWAMLPGKEDGGLFKPATCGVRGQYPCSVWELPRQTRSARQQQAVRQVGR